MNLELSLFSHTNSKNYVIKILQHHGLKVSNFSCPRFENLHFSNVASLIIDRMIGDFTAHLLPMNFAFSTIERNYRSHFHISFFKSNCQTISFRYLAFSCRRNEFQRIEAASAHCQSNIKNQFPSGTSPYTALLINFFPLLPLIHFEKCDAKLWLVVKQ